MLATDGSLCGQRAAECKWMDRPLRNAAGNPRKKEEIGLEQWPAAPRSIHREGRRFILLMQKSGQVYPRETERST